MSMTERTEQSDPDRSVELIDAATAASELTVSLRTLDRYQAAGLIKPIRTPGGHRRFRRDDVRALLSAEVHS